MKRTAKWLTTVLSLAIVTNSMAVYSAGDAALPSQTSQNAGNGLCYRGIGFR